MYIYAPSESNTFLGILVEDYQTIHNLFNAT